MCHLVKQANSLSLIYRLTKAYSRETCKLQNINPISPTPNFTLCIINCHCKKGRGQLVKIQLFQNMVMLHIKLKRITNAATW